MSEVIEEIKKLYYQINNDFLNTQPFNTREVRNETKYKIFLPLEEKLGEDYEFRVICDETNNTPEIVDNHQLVAKVEWKRRNRVDPEVRYVELIFGMDLIDGLNE